MAWIAVETDAAELVRGEFFCVRPRSPPTVPPRTVAMIRMVFTKLPRGVISRKMIRMAAAVLSQDRKQLAKADPAPQSSGSTPLRTSGHLENWVHDIGIVFPCGARPKQGTHDHQKQDNAQYHHFASPPLQGGDDDPNTCDAMRSSEPGVCNDQKPSEALDDVTGYGYQAEDFHPAGEAPVPKTILDGGLTIRNDPLSLKSGREGHFLDSSAHRPEHNF